MLLFENSVSTNCLRGWARVSSVGSPALPSFQELLVVRRCVRERIVEATAPPFRGVDKSVEIFLDIDRVLNLPRLNPDLRLGCLPSASTRITEMNEWENSGLFLLFW